MRYRDAIDAMVRDEGPHRMYWDGSCAWESRDLLEAARDADAIIGDCDEAGEYLYYPGADNNRPGVYRVRGEWIDPSPVVEVLR